MLEKDKMPERKPYQKNDRRQPSSPPDHENIESGTVDDDFYADEKRKEKERIAEEERRKAEEDARLREAEKASSFRKDDYGHRSDLDRSSSKTPSFIEEENDFSSIDNVKPSDGILDNVKSEQDTWDELSRRAGVDPNSGIDGNTNTDDDIIDAVFTEKGTDASAPDSFSQDLDVFQPDSRDAVDFDERLDHEDFDVSAFHTGSYNERYESYSGGSPRLDEPRVLDNVSNEQDEWNRQMRLGENDPSRTETSLSHEGNSHSSAPDAFDTSAFHTSGYDRPNDSSERKAVTVGGGGEVSHGGGTDPVSENFETSTFYTDSYADRRQSELRDLSRSVKDDIPLGILKNTYDEQGSWEKNSQMPEKEISSGGSSGFNTSSYDRPGYDRPDDSSERRAVVFGGGGEVSHGGIDPVSESFDTSAFHTDSYADRRQSESRDLSHSVKGDTPLGILKNTYDEQNNWEKRSQMPVREISSDSDSGFNPTREIISGLSGNFSSDDLSIRTSQYTGYNFRQLTAIANTFGTTERGWSGTTDSSGSGVFTPSDSGGPFSPSSGGLGGGGNPPVPSRFGGPGGPPPTGPGGGGGGGNPPIPPEFGGPGGPPPIGPSVAAAGGPPPRFGLVDASSKVQPQMNFGSGPMLPMVIPISAPATIMNSRYAAQGKYPMPNIYGGGMKKIEFNSSMRQTRNGFEIVPVGTGYTAGKGQPIALKPSSFVDVDFREVTPDSMRDSRIVLNVKATGERRQRLAMATGMLIRRGGRMAIQQIAANGGEAGAGLGRMLSYTETAMGAVSVMKIPVMGILAAPGKASMKKQFKTGSLVFKSKAEMMNTLHMSKADFLNGLKKGTIVQQGKGFVKQITSRQEFIAHLNKQFEMAGVKIHLSTNLSGNQLIAVSRRYQKRILKEAKLKGLPKAQVEGVIKKLKEAEKMGGSTQLVKSRKFKPSQPLKRSVSRLMSVLSKNGDLAGAGLQTVIGYQRTAANAVKIFVKSVKHMHQIGAIAIKVSKNAAMKAALASIQKNGATSGLGKAYVRHAKKVQAKHEAKIARKAAKKAAFRETKLGKLGTKISDKWANFRNRLRDPFGLKTKVMALRKAAWNKIVGSKLGVWASNTKLFHNPLTRGIGKLFKGLNYAVYKVKQAIRLAAGALILLIIVSSIFTSMIGSALGALSFLSVKKNDRDELVQTLNDLYVDDMRYMTEQSPVNGITFENDKDTSLYEENAKDYKRDKKKFEESTNLAEILSMAYVRFNYDFKNAEFSPSAEANYNSGLAIPADFNFDSAKATRSWTVPDETTTYVYTDSSGTHRETGKLGSVATYTNIPYINWDESSDSYKMIQLWKSKGSKITNGVCTIDGLYMIAVLEKFGHVGDELLIKTSEGKTLPCVVMDIKRSTDPGANEWGHNEGQCIIETEQYVKGGRGVNNLLIGDGRVTGIKNICSYSKEHKSANDLLEEAQNEKKDTKKKDSGTEKTKKHEAGGNEEKLWKALKEQGFSDVSAAAIMANAKQESSFNPKSQNSSGAYGLFQWTNERKSNLMQRKHYDTINTQVEYLCWEFSNGYKGAYEDLKKATTIEKCVDIMVRQYEKPSNQDEEVKRRTEFAKTIYKKYATGDDVMKVGKEMYSASEDLYTGMDAVKKYVTDLYHGSHQIIEKTNSDGKVTDITYRTVFFGDLFTCGLSEDRITQNGANDSVSSGLDGASYMVDGVIPVPYLNQRQGWLIESTKTYSKENFDEHIPGTDVLMGDAGCGLCSTAMAVTYGTGEKVNPGEFAKWYRKGAGSVPAITTEGPAKYGLKTEQSRKLDDAIEALKKGYPVINHWAHHYVLLTGYKSDGKITVNDPGKQDNAYPYSGKEFTKEEIESRTVDNGGPYTAVIPSDDVLANATNDGTTVTDVQKKVLDLAKSKIGCEYKKGSGHSEEECKNDKLDKFDCSGLANWVFYQAGVIDKPVGASGDWAKFGTKVDYKDAVPGDVLTKSGHVAIYIGNNKLIEATKPGSTVQMKTTVRDELKHNVRRVIKNVAPAENYTSNGSVKVGGKTYTKAQLIAALQSKGVGLAKEHQCGKWVRIVWGRLAGLPEYAGLSATPGSGKTAYSYGSALGCEKNIDKEIPIGADVIFKYPGGGDGHIGIYIGDDKYISDLTGSSPPTIKNVKHGSNGTKGVYDGWVWHHSGDKQVVFPA